MTTFWSPTICQSLFLGKKIQRFEPIAHSEFFKGYVLSEQLDCKLCKDVNQVSFIFIFPKGPKECIYKVSTQSMFNNWLDLKAYILNTQLNLAGRPWEWESWLYFFSALGWRSVYVCWQLWWREGCLVIAMVWQQLLRAKQVSHKLTSSGATSYQST